jgi:hypothetical protein
MAERWPTVREASQRTGYNPEHLRRLIRAGHVKAELIGRVYFVDLASLVEYIKRASQHPSGGPQGEGVE